MMLQTVYEPDTMQTRVRIIDAQPIEWVDADLLAELTDPTTDPPTNNVRVDVSGDQLDVFTFTDDYGQRFIYRLGHYDALRDAWQMEWPD